MTPTSRYRLQGRSHRLRATAATKMSRPTTTIVERESVHSVSGHGDRPPLTEQSIAVPPCTPPCIARPATAVPPHTAYTVTNSIRTYLLLN